MYIFIITLGYCLCLWEWYKICWTVLTESTRDRTSAGTWLHYSEILYTLPPQTTNRNNPQHSRSTPRFISIKP